MSSEPSTRGLPWTRVEVPSSVVCRITGSWCAYTGLVFRNAGLHDLGAQAHSVEIAVQRGFDLLTHVEIGDLSVGARRGVRGHVIPARGCLV